MPIHAMCRVCVCAVCSMFKSLKRFKKDTSSGWIWMLTMAFLLLLRFGLISFISWQSSDLATTDWLTDYYTRSLNCVCERNSSQYFLGSPSFRSNWEENEYEWRYTPFCIETILKSCFGLKKIKRMRTRQQQQQPTPYIYSYRHYTRTSPSSSSSFIFFLLLFLLSSFFKCPTAFWERWKRIPFQA